MPRVRKGAARRQKHRKVMKLARGHYGSKSRRFHIAKMAVFRAGVYATRDRRTRKREFRALWITRITAACRMRDMRYSQLMFGLAEAGITLNRKMLSEIAIHDPGAFDLLAQKAQAALPAPASPA
jgi:large subunit ribosomal protein L20